ncbi:MAG: hypothetical protein O7I42_11160 [Alphaproteobacteria bacterium]|nr:hypothetical protein [Alphaproteobacteria bacterium]
MAGIRIISQSALVNAKVLGSKFPAAFPHLIERAAARGALPERALALWYAVGTLRCRSAVLPRREGDSQAVFDELRARGFPEAVVEVCREGLKKGAEVLAPFLLLLWREARRSARHAETDDLPEEVMIGLLFAVESGLVARCLR